MIVGGALVNITDNSNINLGTINPFRYRSYYYDTETQLYYLNYRYYDPKIGRFINSDSFVSTGQGTIGNNMFNYCGNNPVNRIDDGGESWLGLAASVGAITGLINCALAVVETRSINPDASLKEIVIIAGGAAISGFVSGFVAASPLNRIGKGARFAINVGMAFVDAGFSAAASGDFEPLDFTAEVISNVVTSTIETEVIPTPIRGRVSSKITSKRGKAAIINTGTSAVVNTVASIGRNTYQSKKTTSIKKTTTSLIYKPMPTPSQLIEASKIQGPPRPTLPLLTLPKPFEKRICYL